MRPRPATATDWNDDCLVCVVRWKRAKAPRESVDALEAMVFIVWWLDVAMEKDCAAVCIVSCENREQWGSASVEYCNAKNAHQVKRFHLGASS